MALSHEQKHRGNLLLYTTTHGFQHDLMNLRRIEHIHVQDPFECHLH